MKADITWILSAKLEKLRTAVNKHILEAHDRTNLKLNRSMSNLYAAARESQLSPDLEAAIAVRGVGRPSRTKNKTKDVSCQK